MKKRLAAFTAAIAASALFAAPLAAQNFALDGDDGDDNRLAC